jgi:hypothetical protein
MMTTLRLDITLNPMLAHLAAWITSCLLGVVRPVRRDGFISRSAILIDDVDGQIIPIVEYPISQLQQWRHLSIGP